jgi:hypothetical protein
MSATAKTARFVTASPMGRKADRRTQNKDVPGPVVRGGASSDQFDEAMGDFAVAYADQAERDYAALKAAVRKGGIVACQKT